MYTLIKYFQQSLTAHILMSFPWFDNPQWSVSADYFHQASKMYVIHYIIWKQLDLDDY